MYGGIKYVRSARSSDGPSILKLDWFAFAGDLESPELCVDFSGDGWGGGKKPERRARRSWNGGAPRVSLVWRGACITPGVKVNPV